MAKVRGFLTGARGKIGDFVLQKGERVTVLRSNNGVSNPQSASQMAQRVSFATVTNAAKQMLSVIGLSFAGVTDGKLSRRKFIALNNPILKDFADKYIAGEVDYDGQSPACFYKAKDVNQLVPNPYIVSSGSLVLPEQFAIRTDRDNLGTVGEETIINITREAKTITGYELIGSLFGVGAGDQITVVTIQGKTGASVPFEYEGGDNVTANGVPVPNYDWMRFTRMFAPRLVFKSQGLPSLEVLADDTKDTFVVKLLTTLRGCIDQEKSSPIMVNWILDGDGIIVRFEEGNPATFTIEWTGIGSTEFELEGYKLLAIGAVRSSFDGSMWDFSTCRLTVVMDLDSAGGPEANDSYSGLSLGTAIMTYVGVPEGSTNNFMTTGTPYESMPTGRLEIISEA